MDLQLVFLAIFAVFVASLLVLSVVSHLRFGRGRSRSQRTATDAEIDAAVGALSNPDDERRDHRPRRKHRRRVWWTTLGGTYFRTTTRRED